MCRFIVKYDDARIYMHLVEIHVWRIVHVQVPCDVVCICIRARHVAACECTSVQVYKCTSVQVLWLPLPLLLPGKPGSGSEVTWLEKPINNLCVAVEADNVG